MSQDQRCFNHDYRAPFFYMFTMVTAPRRPLFGTCSDNRTHLSEEGATVERLWHAISADYHQIAVSTLCVMPDHIHGILRAKESLPFHIGVPIRAFKAQVTAALRRAHNAPSLQVWEKGYNDKIVWRDGSLAAAKGDVVLLKADGFPQFFKPHGKHFDLCCAGRLLIVSPNLPEEKITRETCLFLNDCATRIAAIRGVHSTPQRP
jgi:REP element-mobilizing transposase RayT